MSRSWMLLFLLAFGTACRGNGEASSVKELAANPAAGNVLLAFGAAAKGTVIQLKGVEPDLNHMVATFSDPALHFKTYAKEGLTVGGILKKTADIAASMHEDATLFWYYSGHGNLDGALAPEGAILPNGKFLSAHQLTAEDILSSLRSARANKKPLARLIVVLDSCYSGQWLGGQQGSLFKSALQNSAGTNAVAREILLVSASTAYEEAADGIAGGAMTKNFLKTLIKLKGSSTATIGSFLDAMETGLKQDAMETGLQPESVQTPQWYAAPTLDILKSPLWMGSGSSAVSPPALGSVTNTSCGLQGSIAQRIADCDYKRTPVPGSSWSMVALTHLGGPAVWRDDSSGFLWADKAPVKMNYVQARTYCYTATGPEFGNLGSQYPFRLPEAIQVTYALENGLALLAPEFKANQEWWTSNEASGQVYSYNGLKNLFTPGPSSDYLMTNCIL